MRLIALGTLFMIGAWMADDVLSIGAEFAVKISIVLVFIPILAATGFFTAQERSWAAARLRRGLGALGMVKK